MDKAASSRDAARDELRALMSAIARKDQGALGQLYERTSSKLYGICLRLLRDEAEAQDALQEIYVTVWNKAALYEPSRASPITWLATVARNRAIDRLRSAGSRQTDDLSVANDLADQRPSSFDILEQAEDAFRLRRCLEELEEKARSMIRTAFFDGATYPELAKRDGVPLPTVKSRIRRSLIRLRECLER